MSAELVQTAGRVITLKISGRLTQTELAAAQQATGKIIDAQGKVRLLILIENFQGTAKEGDWGDISFQMQYDDAIERIAVVCEPQWKEAALLFTGKGVRRLAIEHFEPADLAAAQAWVSAN